MEQTYIAEFCCLQLMSHLLLAFVENDINPVLPRRFRINDVQGAHHSVDVEGATKYKRYYLSSYFSQVQNRRRQAHSRSHEYSNTETKKARLGFVEVVCRWMQFIMPVIES